METTEKIMVDINGVDLGYIDLLVNGGYCSSRTEFLKAAIKNQVRSHEGQIQQLISQKERQGFQTFVGIFRLSKKALESAVSEKRKLNIACVGTLVILDDVTPELFGLAVESINVYGVSICPSKIKEQLKEKRGRG